MGEGGRTAREEEEREGGSRTVSLLPDRRHDLVHRPSLVKFLVRKDLERKVVLLRVSLDGLRETDQPSASSRI